MKPGPVSSPDSRLQHFPPSCPAPNPLDLRRLRRVHAKSSMNLTISIGSFRSARTGPKLCTVVDSSCAGMTRTERGNRSSRQPILGGDGRSRGIDSVQMIFPMSGRGRQPFWSRPLAIYIMRSHKPVSVRVGKHSFTLIAGECTTSRRENGNLQRAIIAGVSGGNDNPNGRELEGIATTIRIHIRVRCEIS